MATVALLLAGCGAGSDEVGARGDVPHPITAAEVEGNAKIRLPAGTVLLSTSFVSFQDWSLTAKFRMPAAALPDFLRDGGFPAPTPGLRAVTNGSHPPSDTWAPDSAVKVSGIDQTQDPVNGVFRRVLFDLDHPADVTVYLVAFTT